jgi:hypothetical protein
MAVGLRSALLAASLLVLACTTSETGFGDGMIGVGMTGGDLRVDAVPVPDGPYRMPDAAVPDAAPAEASVDGVPDAPVDVVVTPDLARDLVPDQALDSKPPVNLANGAACEAATWCKTGFCVDGVCCDRVCNNGCMACRKTRTDLADGTCGTAKDLEGKPCGKACGVAEGGVPAVVQKTCAAGVCGFPATQVAIERCTSDNPCLSFFCDNATARCVSTGCATGTCCCNSPNGMRACMKREMCAGERSCAP